MLSDSWSFIYCLQAVSIARQHNLSVAIFAPGWVWEVASDCKSEKFTENEYKYVAYFDTLLFHRYYVLTVSRYMWK
jgi:hypothetical protein